MAIDRQRIIDLQKSVKIARSALERIQYGASNPDGVAADALMEMWKLERKHPLQGVVGHENGSRQ